MVILGSWQGKSVTLSLKDNGLSISVQDKAGASVYGYDGEGRLWTVMRAGVSYRRGLNGKIVAKWQPAGSRPVDLKRERRWLSLEESARLEEWARETAGNLSGSIVDGSISLSTPITSSGMALLERAARFTRERYLQDVRAYHQVYQPVGILPPDQYMAVVLQATVGCSFNTCTFCTFYRDRPFRIKRPEEFRDHTQAVRAFLGDGLSLRRTIFLGDANALVTPMPRLLDLLGCVHDTFNVERLGGIYAFLDGFSGEKKTPADYRELSHLGMKRIYIGMESGNAGLLRFLKKPGRPDDAVHAVRAIKTGGMAVGVIVLLGAGGRAFERAHISDTVAAINSMDLGMDDLVYFSELVESEGMEYTRAAYAQQLEPLSAEERARQGQAIEGGLRFRLESGTPHISRYDIREFVY